MRFRRGRFLPVFVLLFSLAACLKSDATPIDEVFNTVLIREFLLSQINIVVMVDEGGSIWFSRDVANLTVSSWNSIAIPNVTAFADIAYGNGIFVAVQTTTTPTILDQIYRSPDGVNWTYESVPGASSLEKIAFGGGRFVAVGAGGLVRYSTDGVEWFNSSTGMAGNPGAMVYGNGVFVILEVGTMNAYVSSDGVSWNQSTMTYNNDRLAFSGSFFLTTQSNFANPPVETSVNGIDWLTLTGSSIPVTFSIDHLGFGAGNFQALGTNESYRSADGGYTWQPASIMTTGLVYDFIQINDYLVATGCISACPNGEVWFSDDAGDRWGNATPVVSPAYGFKGIAAGN